MVNTKPVNIGPFQNIVEVGWGSSILIATVYIERYQAFNQAENQLRQSAENLIGYWMCQNYIPWPESGNIGLQYIKAPGSYSYWYPENNLPPELYYAYTPDPFFPSSHIGDPGWQGYPHFRVYDISTYTDVSKSDLGVYLKYFSTKWGFGNLFSSLGQTFNGYMLGNYPFPNGLFDIGCKIYYLYQNDLWSEIDYNEYKEPQQIKISDSGSFIKAPIDGGYFGYDFNAYSSSGELVFNNASEFNKDLPDLGSKIDANIFKKFSNYNNKIKWAGSNKSIIIENYGSKEPGEFEIYHSTDQKSVNHPIADLTEHYNSPDLNYGRWVEDYNPSSDLGTISWGTHTINPVDTYTLKKQNDKEINYAIKDVGIYIDNDSHNGKPIVTGFPNLFFVLEKK